MRKKYKVGLVLLALLIIGIVIILVGSIFREEEKVEKKAVQVNKIDGFDYTLDDRDTLLMKDVFISLKEILESDDIDYDNYAEYLSELFVIDTFTINNKINKYDVPALEYLLEENKTNFRLLIEDTLYKFVEDNSMDNRMQVLPEVSNIKMESIKEDIYKLGEVEYPSYVVNLTWEYVKDLDYDDEASITLIKKEDKLYVVNYDNLADEVKHEEDI